MNRDRKILFVIFLCSLSSLAYEIALTRIFSVSLWYHFAFMIVSIAMLGIGASGTVLSLYPKLRDLSNIGIYSLLLGISISQSYILSNQIPFDPVKLSWSKIHLFYIGLYYVILSIPFFFAGLIIATAFSCMSEKPGLIYGADLLGAGTGSIGILYLMTLLELDRSVFIPSSIALMASFIFNRKKLRTISLILILINFAIVFFRPDFINIRMSPYKSLQVALRYPGAEHLKTYLSPFSLIDTFKSPAVRYAPGLSLGYLEAIPEQIGFSIDGGGINAITSTDDRDSLKFLSHLPSAIAYEIGKKDDVLILDPKGGLQVLMADYYSSENIFKVETNPLIIKIIRSEFKDFSGDIYGERTWKGLGRFWLKSTERKFDIIDISLMGTIPSGSYGIIEEYRFTIEAFKEYVRHLKPDGFLSINLFILPPPRTELRITMSILTSLNELGVKDKEKHLAALRSWGSICILLKKSPLTQKEIEAIKQFSQNRGFDLVYYSGIKEEESNIYIQTPKNEYFWAFKQITNPETRNDFIQNYLFDINPVRDDRPFFHYFLKFKNIRDIYQIMGRKWQYFIEEGYILPAVFIQVFALSLILILLPAISTAKKKAKVKVEKKDNLYLSSGLNLLPYFAFLGIGFMFVEISLIQKMILPLENPPYAVATVLTSMLISSGIGSLLSHRIQSLRRPYVTVAISLLIVPYSIFLPHILAIVSPYPMPLKFILAFLTLMPLGLLMGIPFPLGIRILSEGNALLVPWAWAINGCFSVLAPILTIMLAMAIGFKMVLWLGALAYVMAFINLSVFSKTNSKS